MLVKATNHKHNLFSTWLVISVLILLTLVFIVFLVYNLVNSRHIIFPIKEEQDVLMAFTDIGFNGNSTIDDFFYTNRSIDLQYTLKEGANWPKVFTILCIGSSGRPFDASAFKSVSIKVRESTHKQIQIYLKTFLPGISSPNAADANTLRHNAYLLNLNSGSHIYKLDFDRFVTPGWWFEFMQITPSGLPEENFKKVVSFDLQFNLAGAEEILNQKQHIIIEKIMFSRPLFSFTNILILGFLAFFCASLLIFIRLYKSGNSKSALLMQNPVTVESKKEQALVRIREFMKTHYNDPAISTRMLYQFLGIPAEKVFALVSEEYGLTFKQLINKMRIEEAKRLLRESDLRIAEIAMNIGFNELTYFSRLFKKHTNMTPSDFRDKARSK